MLEVDVLTPLCWLILAETFSGEVSLSLSESESELELLLSEESEPLELELS